MLSWKYVLGILCALSLAITAPNAPAKAGDNSAIAGGIMGMVGSAIIMNQMMQGARLHRGARPHTSRRKASKSGPSSEAASSKDPFAGESAPASYAKPVNNSK